jgi:uncharacterized tellurite resistance protein B-like protein
MLDAIRRFVTEQLLGPEREKSDPSANAARVRLAACALLLELAHADNEFSAEEQNQIESTIRSHFGLDQPAVMELMRLAEQERSQSLDHFQFTRLISAEFDLNQKLALAEIMWRVILADGRLSDHETHLVRKMASLMQLDPASLAQARRAALGEAEAETRRFP